jgi:cell wall-associated NlpC family hydrolase
MSSKFDFVRKIIEIAASEAATRPNAPQERCGVIVKDGDGQRLIECANTATNPCETFRISAEDWAFLNVDHEVLALWHTHPNADAAPTQADLKYIELTGVPWHIVSWPQGGHSYTEPTGYEAPYTGRPFVHGVLDCYALCRDWYRREMNIDLPDDEREELWWDKGQNLYLDGFEKNGFVSIGKDIRKLQRGDGILMQIGATVPNHAAVYLGDGKILQHNFGRLSGITTFGGQWLKHSTHFLRHHSLT